MGVYVNLVGKPLPVLAVEWTDADFKYRDPSTGFIKWVHRIPKGSESVHFNLANALGLIKAIDLDTEWLVMAPDA